MSYTMVGMDSQTVLAVIEELGSASDRAAAIVGGALVHSQLMECLKYFAYKRAIKTGVAPQKVKARTLRGLAKHGFSIGMYNHRFFDDFDKFIKVRNLFAHDVAINSFDLPQCKKLAARMTLCKRYVVEHGHKKKRPKPGTKFEDFPYWFAARDLDAKIAHPRSRYILTLQCLLYGLTAADGSR